MVHKVLWGLIAIGWALGAQAGAPTAAELLIQADALYPLRYEPETLQATIGLYEEALALDPENPEILGRLAQAWYEWGILMGEGETAFRRAADLGFRALGLEGLQAAQQLSGDGFRAFLAGVDDPAALLWAADSWGQILGKQSPFAAFGSVPKIRAMYERLIEVDESYFGGGGHRSLGALLANLHANLFARLIFGAELSEARLHFERLLEIAPGYLTNYVVYAREYAMRTGDRELFEGLLRHVLVAPIGDWPFWNRMAKLEAEELLGNPGLSS